MTMSADVLDIMRLIVTEHLIWRVDGCIIILASDKQSKMSKITMKMHVVFIITGSFAFGLPGYA